MKPRLARIFGLALIAGAISTAWAATPHVVPIPKAQEASPTPVPLVFPTITPTPLGGVTATPTRTPTPVGPALAEPLDEANVRAGPGINFDRLGTIQSGQLYPIIGRSHRYPWLQIEFPDSPDGTAWVYEDLVNIIGNPANIPYVEDPELPTVNPTEEAINQTAEVLVLTPGAVATATATAQFLLTGVFEGNQDAGMPTRVGQLPTFTPPPPLPQPTIPIPPQRVEATGGLPPAIPIIALGTLGLLGLVAGIIRRII